MTKLQTAMTSFQILSKDYIKKKAKKISKALRKKEEQFIALCHKNQDGPNYVNWVKFLEILKEVVG